MENEEIEVLDETIDTSKEAIDNSEKIDNPKKKKKKKELIIGISIIIILIIVIGLIVFFLLKNKNQNKETKEDSNTITIIFNSKGGSEVKEITLDKGSELKLPETTKEGYKFIGWFKGATKIEENTKFEEDSTLNAKWEKDDERKTITISFDTSGGTKIKSITHECGQPLFLDVDIPEKDIDNFTFWTNKKNGTKYTRGLILDCEDTVFEANWERKTTIVQYYYRTDEKEEFIESQTYTCGEKMNLELLQEPKIEGYDFHSWIYSNNQKEAKNGDKLTCGSYNTIYAIYVRHVDTYNNIEPEEEAPEQPTEETNNQN